MCLRVAPAADTSLTAAPLRVTLAWADPAPLPAAARQLVVDLDLAVIDGVSGASWAPNGGAARDTVNTVERVGPGELCPPRHPLHFESSSLELTRLRGSQYPPSPLPTTSSNAL